MGLTDITNLLISPQNNNLNKLKKKMIALTTIKLTMQITIDQLNTRIKINIIKNEMWDHGHKNRMLKIRLFIGFQWSSENT